MNKSRKHRWLWPSSDCFLLRRDNYAQMHYATCDARPEDVLVPGSGSDSDEGIRYSKRRRVMNIGRAYLSGQPILVPSAILKGPFRSATHQDNLEACIEETTSLATRHDSSFNAATRKGRDSSDQLDQEVVRNTVRASDLPPKPAKFNRQPPEYGHPQLQMSQVTIDHMELDENEWPRCSLRSDIEGDAPLVSKFELVNEHIELPFELMEAKRLASVAIGKILDDFEGAERLSHAAMQNNERRGLKSNLQPRSDTTYTGRPHSKVSIVDRVDHTSQLSENSSPFRFSRRAPTDHRHGITKQVAKQNEFDSNIRSSQVASGHRNPGDIGIPKESHIASDGKLSKHVGLRSTLREELGRLKRRSLDREETGVEENLLVDPSPLVQKAARHAVMNVKESQEKFVLELPGKTDVKHINDGRTSSTEARESVSGSQSKAIHGTNQVHKSHDSHSGNVAVAFDARSIGSVSQHTTPICEEAAFSTQAALREAHLELIQTSPARPSRSPKQPILHQDELVQEASQSPAPAITPFAMFNERWDARDPETQDAHVSTQAMLDAFSPFKFSQPNGVATPSLHDEGRHDVVQQQVSSAPGTENDIGLPNGSMYCVHANLDGAITGAAPAHPKLPAHEVIASPSAPHPQSSSVLKDYSFKITKTSTQSSAEEIKVYSAQYFPLSRRDINRSTSQPQSTSLSQLADNLVHTSKGQSIGRPGPASQAFLSATKASDGYSPGPLRQGPNHDRAASLDGGDILVTGLSHPPLQQSVSQPLHSRPLSLKDSVDTHRSADRACFTFEGHLSSTRRTLQSETSGGSSYLPKSALRRTQRSSMQEGQRIDDHDLVDSLDELRQSILGSWDVDTAMQKGVGAA